MINIEKLSKNYSGTNVLDIENIQIPSGQSFGLVGNNGAGKTTMFNLILDLIPPTAGYIKINDIQVNKSEKWKPFTTAYIDETFIISYLFPEEFFEFLANLRGVDKQELHDFLDYFKDFFNDEILGKEKYIRDLSKGNQKKVGIVGALIGNPKLIVLDEPFANLDPSTQIRLKTLLNQLRKDKEVTLLISSHDLGHITEVTDRIVVLDKGLIVKDIETNTNTLNELEIFFQEQIQEHA